MSKVISPEMKALVKSSPFYLMMLLCAKDSGVEETIDAIKAWEEQNMPKLLDVMNLPDAEVPHEAKLIALVYNSKFSRPFEADDLHGMIDEFLARVDATPELAEEELKPYGSARAYYTAKKAEFANV
ncbi:hypothetical protein KWAN_79 [Erwinia phage vB_EamM_Kwan]|uniref:Uncharacterized protein n=1 Tax=Erwinia phage vB_EamM_Kwan TaxID=1883374 RepID=A0A1B2IDU1_9CAUD|nr:hypothetical protein BIZ80_gp220 [Erwinia phage vB_EamM_Kwan]ANZ49431.1 hypothetical protein KWAN_79 [Erwinia phage vB_EamM_Kwan]